MVCENNVGSLGNGCLSESLRSCIDMKERDTYRKFNHTMSREDLDNTVFHDGIIDRKRGVLHMKSDKFYPEELNVNLPDFGAFSDKEYRDNYLNGEKFADSSKADMELFDINLKNKGHYGCLSEEVDDDKGLAEGTSSYPPYQSEFGFPYRTNCAQTVSLQSNVTFDLHEKSEHLKEKQDTLIDTMKIDNQKDNKLNGEKYANNGKAEKDFYDIKMKNKGHFVHLSEEVHDDKDWEEGVSSYHQSYQREFGLQRWIDGARIVSLNSKVSYDLHEKSKRFSLCEHLKEKRDDTQKEANICQTTAPNQQQSASERHADDSLIETTEIENQKVSDILIRTMSNGIIVTSKCDIGLLSSFRPPGEENCIFSERFKKIKLANYKTRSHTGDGRSQQTNGSSTQQSAGGCSGGSHSGSPYRPAQAGGGGGGDGGTGGDPPDDQDNRKRKPDPVDVGETEDKVDDESQKLQKNKIERMPPEDSSQQVSSAGPQCPQQDPSVPQQDSRVPNQVAHGNLMGIELMTAFGMLGTSHGGEEERFVHEQFSVCLAASLLSVAGAMPTCKICDLLASLMNHCTQCTKKLISCEACKKLFAVIIHHVDHCGISAAPAEASNQLPQKPNTRGQHTCGLELCRKLKERLQRKPLANTRKLELTWDRIQRHLRQKFQQRNRLDAPHVEDLIASLQSTSRSLQSDVTGPAIEGATSSLAGSGLGVPLTGSALQSFTASADVTHSFGLVSFDVIERCTSIGGLRLPIRDNQASLSSWVELCEESDVHAGVRGRGRVQYGEPHHICEIAKFWNTLKGADLTSDLDGGAVEGIILSQELIISNGEFTKGVHYEKVSFLGSGVTGKCHLLVQLDNDHLKFCRKKLTLLKFEASELEIWSDLSHPGIIKLLGAVRHRRNIYIFSELADGGSIRSLINQNGRFNCWFALDYLQQLLRVLDYLESKRIVHEDLKTDNILTFAESNRLVIIDWGLARILPADREYTAAGEPPVGGQTQYSPEKAGSEGHNWKSDVWGQTCCFNEMLSGYAVWFQRYRSLIFLHYKIKTESPPLDDIPDGLPDEVVDLITQGWTVDKQRRPSAAQLLQHPAFNLLERHPSDPIFTRHIELAGPLPPCDEGLMEDDERDRQIRSVQKFLEQEDAAQRQTASVDGDHVTQFEDEASAGTSSIIYSRTSIATENEDLSDEIPGMLNEGTNNERTGQTTQHEYQYQIQRELSRELSLFADLNFQQQYISASPSESVEDEDIYGSPKREELFEPMPPQQAPIPNLSIFKSVPETDLDFMMGLTEVPHVQSTFDVLTISESQPKEAVEHDELEEIDRSIRGVVRVPLQRAAGESDGGRSLFCVMPRWGNVDITQSERTPKGHASSPPSPGLNLQQGNPMRSDQDALPWDTTTPAGVPPHSAPFIGGERKRPPRYHGRKSEPSRRKSADIEFEQYKAEFERDCLENGNFDLIASSSVEQDEDDIYSAADNAAPGVFTEPHQVEPTIVPHPPLYNTTDNGYISVRFFDKASRSTLATFTSGSGHIDIEESVLCSSRKIHESGFEIFCVVDNEGNPLDPMDRITESICVYVVHQNGYGWSVKDSRLCYA